MTGTGDRPLVRLEDLSGADSWSWAVRALRAAAAAQSQSDAWIDVGRVLQQLDDRAVRDIAITLAVLPRFGLHSSSVSVEQLDDLAARMAYVWADDEPSDGAR